MYTFGRKSKERLETCHPDIQLILNELIRYYDFSVLEGHRSQETQMKYFSEGKSTLDGVNKKSKHQSYPSMAVDISPYVKGVNMFTDERGMVCFYHLAGMVIATAKRLKAEGLISHDIRWGGAWRTELNIFSGSTFFDGPHFELVKT